MRQASHDRITRLANKRRIQEYMDIAGETQATLAVKIGVTPQLVNAFLNGRGGSKRVLSALLSIGVPARLLFFIPRKESE